MMCDTQATSQTNAQLLEQRVQERTREIERRQHVAEGLRDILVVLNSNRSRDEILAYIVRQACMLLDANACILYQVEFDMRRVLIEASFGLPEAMATVHSLSLSPAGTLGHADFDCAILNREPYAIADFAESPLAAAVDEASVPPELLAWCAAITQHYRASLNIPLTIKGQPGSLGEFYGSLGFYYASPQQLSEEDISLGVTVGSQAALAIENARLRVQAGQAAVLQERSRLARDLHDSVTQSLYSLTLLAEAGRRLARGGDLPRAEEAMSRLSEIGQQALKEMRLLVYELRPLALKRVGLVGALQQRLDTVERRAGIEAHLLVEGKAELPLHLEEELYHILQEALNNALKHAEASTVTVQIRVEESPALPIGERAKQSIHIAVIDNGRGFDLEAVAGAGGMGLISMRERVDKLGGTLTILSTPGEGTRVHVCVAWVAS